MGAKYCCVVGCTNSQSRNRQLTFYSFPRRSWEIIKRNEWIKAVKRITFDNKPWQPNKNTRICSAHFVGGKQSNLENSPAYVPTIFPPVYQTKVISKLAVARHERLLKRKKRKGAAKVLKPQETESLASDNETGGDELVSARDRFKGALQELLPHSEEDSDSRSEDDNWSKSKRSVRKKIQNDKSADDKQQPFVMKLCDRSVDLAQFNESTPLYVICRAWMANQPHQMYNITVPTPKRPRSPEIKEEPVSPCREEEAMAKDTYSLPPPYKCESTDTRNVRIPKPIPRDTEFTKLFDEGSEPPSKEELLKDNRKLWLKVRKSWYDAAAENEKRYSRSLKTIASIFNRA